MHARGATVVLTLLSLTPDLPSPEEPPKLTRAGCKPSLQSTQHESSIDHETASQHLRTASLTNRALGLVFSLMPWRRPGHSRGKGGGRGVLPCMLRIPKTLVHVLGYKGYSLEKNWLIPPILRGCIANPPPPLYKLRQSPKSIRSLRLL